MIELPAVSALLFRRGPMAIVFLVWAVVVLAIQGFTWRASSHILGKGLEAIQPTLANRYSTTAVVFPPFVLWVEASLFHLPPDVPEASVPASVRRIPHDDQDSANAAAADGIAGPHVVHSLETSISAITFELPNDAFALTALRRTDRDQPSESLACNVLRVALRHGQFYQHMYGASAGA